MKNLRTTENAEHTETFTEELYNHPLSGSVISCAIEVHRHLGAGLLESTYQRCLAKELSLNGISFRAEHPMPVSYKGTELNCGYRIDLWIEDFLVVELNTHSPSTADYLYEAC